jgi:predicted nucleotidyltransferase
MARCDRLPYLIGKLISLPRFGRTMPRVGVATVPLLGCFRCAHLWIPRTPVVSMCPRCKSRLWDIPRIRRRPRTRRGADTNQVIGPFGSRIVRLARRFHASDPRVFGSVARGEATPTSDVDIVVRFDAEATLFDQIRFQRAVQRLLHRRVDVVSESAIHWYAKPQILAEAVRI